MTDSIKSQRRSFLKGGLIVGVGALVVGVPLVYQSPLFEETPQDLSKLGKSEKNILMAMLTTWCDSWPKREVNLEEELLGVLKVIRFDKRAELLTAVKLLNFGPACFFLTGSFNPWRTKEDISNVLERWQNSQAEVERKLYMAFSSIFGAVFYNSSDTWSVVGYPGPPDVEKGSAL